MKNFYPPEGHDFVNTSEVRRLYEHNQAELEAKYIYNTAKFRQDFFGKLERNSAIFNNVGWALFRINEPSDLLTDGGQKETLLLSLPHPENIDDCIPFTRIFTQELITGDDGVQQWLTQDFTLDYENDAAYLVDSFDPEHQAIDQTWSVLFSPEGNGLIATINARFFTFEPAVNDPQSTHVSAFPFGKHTYLEDRIQALAYGQELLAEVINRQPDAVYEAYR